MPSNPTGFELASFANFFDTKATHIRAELEESTVDGGFSVMLVPYFDVVRVLSRFQPVGVDNVELY